MTEYTDFKGIKYSKIARIVSSILLLLIIITFVWVISSQVKFGDFSTYGIAILFFLPIIKYLESILVFKITLDKKNSKVILGRSGFVQEISKHEIKDWGIRKINRPLTESALPKNKYLEVHLKNGNVLIYPLSEIYKLSPYSETEYLNLLTDTLEVHPTSYEDINWSLQYNISFLLL